jgi:hypothetical protein
MITCRWGCLHRWHDSGQTTLMFLVILLLTNNKQS